MKRIIRIIILCAFSMPAYCAKSPIVLLLNSYHPQYKWTAELTRGVQDTLVPFIPGENLHVEFMDARRFVNDDSFYNKLEVLLKHKYKHYKPSVIITSDDHAFDFWIEHGDTIFPNIPVIFSGVNTFNQGALVGRKNFTGILEGMEIEGNLKLISRLQPNVKRIILLSDKTELGVRMTKHALEIKKIWATYTDLSIEIWDDFTVQELNQDLAKLKQDTAVLFLAIHKDKAGEYFSYDEHFVQLTAHSAVPVYGMWGTLIVGNGGLGGMMNNPYLHGSNATQLALRVLKGEDVNAIPIKEKAVYLPYFDYRQLKRFNIDENLLPENSVVLFKPKSLHSQNPVLFNSIIIVIASLTIIICVMNIAIRRRKAIQNEIEQSNLLLEAEIKEKTSLLDERNKQLEVVSSQLRVLAYTDSLTGLANRRAGMQKLAAFVRRCNLDDEPLSIAMLDLDFFKRVNDTYGHSVGDKVLVVFSEALKKVVRPSDYLYRYGGEEFIIIFPNTTAKSAEAVCKRIHNKIRLLTMGPVSDITVSIGLYSFASGDTMDNLLERADKALYFAKNNGRNQTVLYIPDIKPEISHQTQILV